jgi:hypothetical protein
MDGNPIKLAVEALKLFLHSIPLGSKFNVYSFGSEFKKIFNEALDYNEGSLKNALS